jgi:PKD repeat protein
VTLNIDKTNPGITASVTPAAVNVVTIPAVVSFTCSDALSGTASCPASINVTTAGANEHFSGTATDKAGNSASTTLTLNVQQTALSVSASAAPAANAAGWNNTNVTITYACAGGVPPVQCPATNTVTLEGANQVLNATATDAAGQTANATTTLNIDKTPPAITATVAPVPGANGVVTAPAVITFNCSDGLSDIAICPAPINVTTTGAGQVFSGSATDKAGNTTSTSVTLSVQLAPLSVIANPAPPPNGAGWNNTDVTVSFACAGGVPPLQCPATQTVSTQGANQSISGTVTDANGQTASTSITINLDKGQPVITAAVFPPADGSGVVIANAASVTFACSDSLSGVANCPRPTTLTNAGLQNISGTATDFAGNMASTSIQVNLVLPPALQVIASVAPAPNASGWNNSPVTVSFQCSGGVPPISCPPSQTVFLDGANQVITGTATDASGSSASANATVNLDQTPPLLSITSPANGGVAASANVPVSGLAGDSLSGLSSITCNGTPAIVSAGAFTCSFMITQGSISIAIQATDIAGNSASSTLNVSLQGAKLTITSPGPLALFTTNSITVKGTIDDPSAVVSVNGVQATINGTTFTATGVVLQEGKNSVTATALNSGGAATTASVNVILDTTPPTVRIDSPSDQAVLTTPQIYVTGLVNDVVSGTVNAGQVTVFINGVLATVGNRSFMAEDVLLVPGKNVITAIATDRAGNVNQSQITVTLQDTGAQQRLLLVAGNAQSGLVGTTLPQPLVVQAINSLGQAIPNVPVSFTVAKSDGQLNAFPQQGRQITVQTDGNGQASVSMQLGSRVGNGNNQVLASSPGFIGEVMFCETSKVGTPAQVHVVSGESQTGSPGEPLPESLEAIVVDAGGNPVSGLPVIFQVEQGGGQLEGTDVVTKITDDDGRVAAVLSLAQQEGINNNVVSASFTGLTGSPATFLASAISPRNPADTKVTGIVLDNANQPIPNATASIKGTNLSALTDISGRFTISGVPIGALILFIDGASSTRPETFPFLEFPLVTVAGQDNHLSGPIFLPQLDMDNSKVVGGDEDVVLTLKGNPGVAYTVFAHSATFPDGSKSGRLTLSAVHADKVPMAPPNGTAPAIVGTLQPARIKFNPPIRMQVPNSSGMPAGQVVEVYSFDHDLEQFVSGGTARVSEDGSVIVTDPGFGLRQSGWHAAPPPAPPKTCASGCDDRNPCTSDSCVNGACQHTPLNGGSCDDRDQCTVNDRCQTGACRGDAKKITSVTVKADGKTDQVTHKTKEDVAFSVDAQQQNCGSLKYKWDFGDGKTSTEQNPTHQYKEPNTYHVTVQVTCDTQKNCSSQSGSIDVNIIGIKIELCKDPTQCDITQTPDMQTIHVKATIQGKSPDPTASTTFQWNAKLTFETRDCSGSRALGDPDPLSGSSTGGQFDVLFQQVRGGSLQVTATATVDGVDLKGDTKDQDATKNLKIRGQNPARSNIQSNAGTADLQMIACQESGQRQFNAAADNGRNVCSVWNGGGDGGVGVMQITPPENAGNVWRWDNNVARGVSKFNTASGSAGRYRNNVTGSGDWRNAVAFINSQRAAQHLPPITVSLRAYTPDELRLDSIRCFNGAAGREFFGAGLHEYRVIRSGTTNFNGANTPILTINANGAADWERVPVTDRPATGDRCYVQHVLLQSPSCPTQVHGSCP